MPCVLVKWEDIKEQIWLITQNALGIFFPGDSSKSVCDGLPFLGQQWCSFPAATLCKRAATRRNQKQLAGLWEHIVSNVLPGMRSELALAGVNILAKSNIIYLLQGPALSPTWNRAGDACRQFFFPRIVRQVHHREQKYHNYTIIWPFTN